MAKPKSKKHENGHHNPGYPKHPREHHENAIKGKRSTISKAALGKLRHWYEDNKSSRSVKADTRGTAKTVLDPTDEEEVRHWKQHFSRYDLDGVDTKEQMLTMLRIRAAAGKKVQGAKEKVTKAKKAAQEEKAQAGHSKGIIAGLAAAIKEAVEEIAEAVTGAEAAQKMVQQRTSGRWSANRKAAARSVADMVQCSVIEADALITRARNAGVEDWASFNWDSLQGKNYIFDERLDMLEKKLGVTYTGKEVRQGRERLDWELRSAQYREALEEALDAQHYVEIEEVFGGNHEAWLATHNKRATDNGMDIDRYRQHELAMMEEQEIHRASERMSRQQQDQARDPEYHRKMTALAEEAYAA